MRCDSEMNGWSCELPADHTGAHVQHGDCCFAEWTTGSPDDAPDFLDDFADAFLPLMSDDARRPD